MLRDLQGKIQRYPITCATIAISTILFVAVRATGDGWEAWGHGHSELYWRGEIWRLLVNALHHGVGAGTAFAIIHLLFNVYWLWHLGRTAEEYFGTAIYGGFLLSVAIVTGLASELTIESGAAGLSGVVYGVLGFLYAARFHSERIRETVNPSIVQFFVGWLFLYVALTWLKVLPIANVAHFSGAIYGWASARVLFPTHREPRWRKVAFLASHVLVVAAALYAMFPLYNPLWRAWKGERAGTAVDKVEHYAAALRLDPSLAAARFNLALALSDLGRVDEAVEHLSILSLAHPDEPDYPRAAAQILRAAGRPAEANKFLDRIREE
jgi:membrane associated rhomboid family serine protease